MYSFDVFDTLITRTTANPWGIFALMKKRLEEERQSSGLDSYVIENFFELRIHSEELARKAGIFQQVEEVRLKDIYSAMSLCGCITEEQEEYLYRTEQDTEVANAVGIPEQIQKLKELLGQGRHVVLISDMYLPEETIRKMLLRADPVFKTIPLYISSEYRKRKTTGNLYRLVQEKENISYGEWLHTGDHLHQDIEIPLQLGMNVELVPKMETTKLEKKLLDAYGDDLKLQLLAGTAMNVEAVKRGACEAYHVGCRYAGPVLYSYGEWLVEQAEKKKINRLYFIARDGYLVKKIVDMILDLKKINITTKYIYGSRKAWRMPSLSGEHYNLYQLVLWSHINRIRTLGELAAVLHVPLQGLYGYLPGTYGKNRENDRISNQELEYIVRKLEADRDFREYHLGVLKEERALAQQYLFQEIDVSDDSFAFVDVSGGGLTQGCLRLLVREQYEKPIHTFFFKVDRVNLVEGSVTDTFLPSFLESNLTVEMMCRAPHGQTEKYGPEFRNGAATGRVVPILGQAETEALIRHGFPEYEKGILDFAGRMCQIASETGIRIASAKNVILYLKHIAEEPSRDVLEYFGSMPSSESGRGREVLEYAPKLTKEEIGNIFLLRTNEPMEFLYKGTDLNYSVMRASQEEKELIERYKKEHDGPMGIMRRQQTQRKWQELRSLYGSAAFYPVRLLEERVILYGAGKFGQNLYRKLTEDGEHQVVLWVDQNAEKCRAQGLENVRDVSALNPACCDQVVIAVINQDLASEIREELQSLGIAGDQIIWLPLAVYPGLAVRWDSRDIG